MRRIAAVVLSVLGVLAFARPAAAAYPDRNVTIVVPYPAGGPTDRSSSGMTPAWRLSRRICARRPQARNFSRAKSPTGAK